MYLLFFLYTILLGLYLLSFFPSSLPFLIKISLVYLLGTLFLTVLFFVCYPLLAISPTFLYLPFVLLLPLVVHRFKRMKNGFKQIRYRFISASDLLISVFSLSFSSFLFLKTIWFDVKTGQTLISGKLWSDFGAHIPLIKSFSTGFNFPPQYPLFPGEPIRYHFLFDFLVGILEKLGLPLFLAINIPSILSFTVLLLLIYCLATLIFSRKIIGILAVFLTLFNSSWAFLALFKKIPFTNNFFSWVTQIVHHKEFLAFGPYDQGIVTAFWNLNVYTNQRHFAFALALFFLVIYLFFYNLFCHSRRSLPRCYIGVRLGFYPMLHRDESDMEAKALLLLGIIIGLLPVVHSGVFLIAIISLPLFFICILRETIVTRYIHINRSLILTTIYQILLLLLPIIILSLPQLLYMQGTPSALPEAGIKFRPGYLNFINFAWSEFLKFWVFNLGLTLFIAPLGFLLAPKKSRLLFLLAPLPFILGNLFSFSPDIATNHKFFNFGVIILNFYLAYFLFKGATLFKGRTFLKYVGYTLSVILLFFLTLSGILDFFPIINDNFFGVPDLNQKADIAWIEQNTSKTAVFANSYWLYHPASIAGRRIVLGWPYFSWSAGYDTNTRDKQQRELYTANNIPKTCSLIKKLHVDYVTISTQIKDEATNFNLDFWQKNFPLVYQNSQSGLFIFSVDACHSRPDVASG